MRVRLVDAVERYVHSVVRKLVARFVRGNVHRFFCSSASDFTKLRNRAYRETKRGIVAER